MAGLIVLMKLKKSKGNIMKPEIIYVAGPYSQGDVAENVRNAMYKGMEINDLGHYAVIPHLTHFLHMFNPRPYKYWLDLDNRIIPKCTAITRIAGESDGADKELELAMKLGLKIL
jgi:hypothetical protein